MSTERITTREAAAMLGVAACEALPVLRAGGCRASRIGPGRAGWLLWRRADVEALARTLADARRTASTPEGKEGGR